MGVGAFGQQTGDSPTLFCIEPDGILVRFDVDPTALPARPGAPAHSGCGGCGGSGGSTQTIVFGTEWQHGSAKKQFSIGSTLRGNRITQKIGYYCTLPPIGQGNFDAFPTFGSRGI